MSESANSMEGKICMVTGATAGIGLAVAKGLSRQGAMVIVVGRDAERGREALADIRADSRNAAATFMRADLSSQQETRELAQHFLSKYQRLDVLVNNAGAFHALRKESVDGIEMTFALNHLGPFLLTNLLLDALKAAAPARIVNVASEAHGSVDGFDFDDPQAARMGGFGSYPRSEISNFFHSVTLPWAHPGFQQYSRSKLANILFTTELARRLAGTRVTANSLHPGVVSSNFSAGNGSYGWMMRRFFAVKGITVEEGAATPLYLASSPEVEGISGRYFVDKRVAPCSKAARDADAAAKLWQLSERLTG